MVKKAETHNDVIGKHLEKVSSPTDVFIVSVLKSLSVACQKQLEEILARNTARLDAVPTIPPSVQQPPLPPKNPPSPSQSIINPASSTTTDSTTK